MPKSTTFFLPPPSWKNVHLVYSVIIRYVFHKFLQIRYIEPTIDTSGYISWLIEFHCVFNGDAAEVVSFLKDIKEKFQKQFSCSVINIRYNFKDRITIIASSKGFTTKDNGAKNRTPRYGIGFIPSSVKTLDEEKKTTFENDHTATNERQKNRKSKNSRLKAYNKSQVRIANKYRSSDSLTVKKDDIKISVDGLEKVEKSTTCDVKSPRDVITSTSVAVIPAETIDSLPSNAMTRSAALVMKSRSHALARLNDHRIFSMVRTYLAYLEKEKANIVYDGETRISLGMKITSEGLPLKDELKTLWYEFGEKRGLTIDEIKSDLESYAVYCKSSRITRLQNMMHGTRKWLGLKGGIPSSSLSSVTVDRRHLLVLDTETISSFQ